MEQQQTLYAQRPVKQNWLWSGLAVLGLLLAAAAWLYWIMPELFLGEQSKQTDISLPEQSLMPSDHLQAHTHLSATDSIPFNMTSAALFVDENKPLNKDEQWLIQQNGEHYTLQVMGTHDPMNLSLFIQKYQLANIRMFETQYQDKAWYVLVSGVYSSRSAADQALSELSEPLKQHSKPWVRRLSGIQASIRQ